MFSIDCKNYTLNGMSNTFGAEKTVETTDNKTTNQTTVEQAPDSITVELPHFDTKYTTRKSVPRSPLYAAMRKTTTVSTLNTMVMTSLLLKKTVVKSTYTSRKTRHRMTRTLRLFADTPMTIRCTYRLKSYRNPMNINWK